MYAGRILIIEDRYAGMYSGGKWLGVVDSDRKQGDISRGAFVVDQGPSDGDISASAFWADPPTWIVAGQSPKHVMDLIGLIIGGTTNGSW